MLRLGVTQPRQLSRIRAWFSWMGASNSREPDAPATAPPRASQMSSNCPVAEEPGALPEGSCPLPEKYRSPNVYNVYNQKVDPSGAQQSPMLRSLLASAKLDPRNNMPLEPNQRPWPGQEKPISTERIVSTIPKGGTDGTWVYPSPQMFYNGRLPRECWQSLVCDVAPGINCIVVKGRSPATPDGIAARACHIQDGFHLRLAQIVVRWMAFHPCF